MYRIRDEIITTLAQQIAQVLADGTKLVLANLQAWLVDFTDRIPFVASEARIVEEIFRPVDTSVPGQPAGPTVGADSLTSVRRLAALGRKNLDQA
jgi:hypothetical protein